MPQDDYITEVFSNSSQWPDWVCKNGCQKDNGSNLSWPKDTKVRKCHKCGSPLVRWRNYQQMRKTPSVQGVSGA